MTHGLSNREVDCHQALELPLLIQHPITAIVLGRRRIRGDVSDIGVGDPEVMLDIDGQLYPLSQLLSAPGILRERVLVLKRNVLTW